MRYKIPLWISIIVIVTVFLSGFRTAIDPQWYTGSWYAVETGERFTFSMGMIHSEDIKTEFIDSASTGAYIFCKDHIFLFSHSISGLEEGRQLYLICLPEGDALCDRKDPSGTIYFARSR